MTLEADNVRVGVSGAVSVAPLGTTCPTTATGALDAAFVDVGYIDDKGVTETPKTDVNEIKAWQEGAVVRKVQTSHDLSYKFAMLETSEATLVLYYGDDEEITGEQLPHNAFVIDVLDGDVTTRLVIADGQVTDRGDVVYNGSEATSREITITAYPDDNGVKAFMYHDGGGVS
jgi:hypothetical protein